MSMTFKTKHEKLRQEQAKKERLKRLKKLKPKPKAKGPARFKLKPGQAIFDKDGKLIKQKIIDQDGNKLN